MISSLTNIQPEFNLLDRISQVQPGVIPEEETEVSSEHYQAGSQNKAKKFFSITFFTCIFA